MSVIPLVTSGIGLAGSIFKWLGDKSSRKHAEALVRYRDRLYEELSKPVEAQDDSLVELLQSKIVNIQELATAQVEAYADKNN